MFHIELPAWSASRAEGGYPYRAPGPDRRRPQLFADAVGPTLSRLGMNVSMATRGDEAIEAVRERPFDVILLDPRASPIRAGWRWARPSSTCASASAMLAVTAVDDPRVVKEALSDRLPRLRHLDVRVQRFVSAVQAVLEGQVVIPRQLATAVGGAIGGGSTRCAPRRAAHRA